MSFQTENETYITPRDCMESFITPALYLGYDSLNILTIIGLNVTVTFKFAACCPNPFEYKMFTSPADQNPTAEAETNTNFCI